MPTPGDLDFCQGLVVDNNDPEKIGRVKIRLTQDGFIENEGMYKGDDDLFWWEPCVLGAGYEVGSLIIPPVGTIVWCLSCQFNTDNYYRLYLGSGYGVGTGDIKNFNQIQVPRETLETPYESLIDYPNTQLLYKSTQGSFLKFMGDVNAGAELCSGIPTVDIENNSNKRDTDTYNFLRITRENILSSVSEMPLSIDKASPVVPEDIPINFQNISSESILTCAVRDRRGKTYNSQKIDSKGIFMNVRGTGGTSSPSENKELQTSVTDTLSKAEPIAEEASKEATEEVQKEGGVEEKQAKAVDKDIEKTVDKALYTPYKLPSDISEFGKQQLTDIQKKIEEIAKDIPGGMSTVNGIIASAFKGNVKGILYHIGSSISALGFQLATQAVKNVLEDILKDKELINPEEASKYIEKIMGEANLGKLIGKASDMINEVGAKLGPFEDVFKQVANTILSTAIGKVSKINAQIFRITGLNYVKDALQQINSFLNEFIAHSKSSLIADTATEVVKNLENAKKEETSPEIPLPEDIDSVYVEGQENQSENSSVDSSLPDDIDSVNTDGRENQASEGDSESNQQGDTDNSSQDNNSESQKDSSKGLTPEQKKAVTEMTGVIANNIQESIKSFGDKVANVFLNKVMVKSATAASQSVLATKEYENLMYLDADGARVLIPGEEMDCYWHINNDGAKVHIGENSLAEINQSNITHFISDPKLTNQSVIIQASNGFKQEIDSGLETSNTITTEANHSSVKIFAEEEKNVLEKDDGVIEDINSFGSSNLQSVKIGANDSLNVGQFLGYNKEDNIGAFRSAIERSGNKTRTELYQNENNLEIKALKDNLGSSLLMDDKTVNIEVPQTGVHSSIKMEQNQIVLQTGESSITLNSDGQIDIKGININVFGATGVSLGAAVNLGFVPGISEGGHPCKMRVGNMDVSATKIAFTKGQG